MSDDTPWHTLAVDVVTARLETSAAGLSDGEAGARLAQHGPNELVDRGSRHPLTIVREQLTAVMVLILIGAAALSLALGKLLEAGAILVIVVLFAALGFVQEYRAERAINALRSMAVPLVRAIRNGTPRDLPARELVPGDVVALEAGNVIPADLRLIEVASLRVQESALTGESEAVDKQSEAIDDPGAGVGDRTNMAYLGTQVVHGRALGVVTATGMDTQLGRIAGLLQSVKASLTPLQERLDRVGKQLAIGGIAVAVVVVIIGLLGGESLADMLVTAISVAVAVIPEGLPAVVTFTLAVGAQRMLRRNALIRTLPAVETLGSVTVICSDKTGTLTENRMRVVSVGLIDHRFDLDQAAPAEMPDGLRLALTGGALCSDAHLPHAQAEAEEAVGDPTEIALLLAAVWAGMEIDSARAANPRVAEAPFDSERKRMTTVHRPDQELARLLDPLIAGLPDGTEVAFVKGAPDRIIDLSASVWTADGPVPMDDERNRIAHEINEGFAQAGRRVLAVAARPFDLEDRSSVGEVERDLTLLGLFAIIDPPRAEVRDSVATCVAAGIRPVMITGDHPLTASAIAAELGIGSEHDALTGRDLEELDDDALRERVERVSVFARVAPEHKLRIVDALQSRGDVVAMTGDGVNDAPALKRADIGIAMGITGTDVSKEASDMVLRDDNFSTIVAAVEEGRVIYDNLRRFVKFAVAGNVGKMIVMVGWPIPFLVTGSELTAAVALLPLQLLWLNLMTDGLLGLSMGIEPAERGVMGRPPHSPTEGIWAGGMGRQVMWIGAAIGLVSLGVGYAYFRADMEQWQSMMFMLLAVMQVFQALGSRSATQTLRQVGLRSNPTMIGIVVLVLALQLVAVYSPLADALKLEPLTAVDLAVCFGAGIALLAALDLPKVLAQRAHRR